MRIIKSVVAVIGTVAMLVFTGCKSLPTVDKMQSVASAIGAAAGLVANETKIDDKARNTIIAIMEEVAKVVPQSGQSFEDAWTPVAKEVVAKLVAEGKITDAVGSLALATFGVVVKGIDYIFDVRYPKAREYEELVSAAVSGFTSGFLAVFTPADKATTKAIDLKVDKDAYKWLKSPAKK